MEKDKKVKVILFAGLILFAVLAMLWEDPVSFEGQEEQYAIKKSEPKEEKERLDKRDIYKLKPKKEDNMQPIDGKESSELALQFTGYDAADPAYDWLQGEDWTRFKEAVAVYLEKKELKEVTTVHVQADSQQKISDYMRYLYFDVDYQTESSDRLVIQATCVIRNVSEVRASFSKYSSNGYDNKDDYEIMCEIEQMRHLLTTYPEQFPDVATGRMVEKLSKKMKMPKSTVGEYLTISKNLGKDAMEKFETGELKKSAAVQMSALPKEEQKELVSAGRLSHKEIKEYKDQKAQIQNPGEPMKKTETSCEHRQIEREPVSTIGEEIGITDSPFPKMKNMEEREAFVNSYKKWCVWCKNEFTEETFYRYNLPDGSSIIVKEYPYSDYWDSTKERIGKQMYLWFPKMKHFKNAEANMTQIKEHLKNLNKDL